MKEKPYSISFYVTKPFTSQGQRLDRQKDEVNEPSRSSCDLHKKQLRKMCLGSDAAKTFHILVKESTQLQ